MVIQKDDIVRIPSTDTYLGSCPVCGKPVWEDYKIPNSKLGDESIYRCIKCKTILLKKSIIPF